MSLPPESKSQSNKEQSSFVDSTISSQVSITIVNAIPESESVVGLKNNEWSSKVTNDYQPFFDFIRWMTPIQIVISARSYESSV